MEQIIKDIQQAFIGFANFSFQIDIENKKLVDYDLEKISYNLFNEVSQIEKHLQSMYLQGNDLTLHRVKLELLKIEKLLEDSDFGININIEPNDFKVLIMPEMVTEINKTKLRYTKQLIEFIDSFIEPQQSETETEQGTPNFINNFDNINTNEIHKHFRTGLVEKGYLTEQELNEYLKAAFELKTKPETLFKLKHTPTKQKIYTVFYIYYKDISQKKHERQKEYAALLGDFFEGYKTEIIQTNWARDYKPNW